MTISAGAELDTSDISDSDTVIPGSGEVILGNEAGSRGTLTVTGLYSDLEAGSDIDVGERGTGRLTIEAGAEASINLDQLQTLSLVVGDQSGSNGAVLVTGAGSRLIANRSFAVVGRAARAA